MIAFDSVSMNDILHLSRHETNQPKAETMTTATTKKITVATVKSFIRKNRAALLVKVRGEFNGMEDMVTQTEESEFSPAKSKTRWSSELSEFVADTAECKNTLGVNGVWFCGRDMCSAFESETHRGFRVYNCCGEWCVAVAK